MKKTLITLTLILGGCGGNGDDGFPSRPDVSPPAPQWQVPQAQLLDIDGDALVGATLEGKYLFVDPNTPPRLEGASELRWRDSQNSTLGMGQRLNLTSAMVGKRIAFCVSPVAQGTAQTRGEERCSLPLIIRMPTGSAPEAKAVSLMPAGGLTVGDTVNGQYTYQDADPQDREGSSRYSWLVDGVVLAGASGQSLLLTSSLQGKSVTFCVRAASVPRDPHNNPTQGETRCSDASPHIGAKTGKAPEVIKLAALGWPAVGNTLQGAYLYEDEDGDQEGTSLRQWKRAGVSIPGATGRSYQLTASDAGTIVGYCVTPVAKSGLPDTGIERCDTLGPVVTTPQGIPPSAESTITVANGDWPHAGALLTGKYQYIPSSTGRPEGNSVSFWRVSGRDQICAGQPCDYNIASDDVGQPIQYCVVPIDNAGLSGPLTCSQITGAAIRLYGHLEYNRTLYADIIGLSGHSRWLVDTSNISGPGHNGSMSEPLGAFPVPAYRIGTTLLAALRGLLGYDTNAVHDLNGNSMIDNREWADAIRNHTAPAIDARHFVGKEVTYCLQTEQYGEICLNASESRGPGDTLCTDDTQCVVGGVYYNGANAGLRGIAPVTRLLLAGEDASGTPIDGSAYFHRPLSRAEVNLKDLAGLGAGLPAPDSSGELIQGGIHWARLSHAAPSPTPTSPALQLCRQLTDGDPVGSWSLPVENNTYSTDSHAAPNGDNQAPTAQGLNNLTLWQVHFGGQVTPVNELDPVFGWPKYKNWSATQAGSTTHKALDWQNGSDFANWGNTSPLLVNCIQ